MFACSLDKIKLNVIFKRFCASPRDVDSLEWILQNDISRIDSNFVLKEVFKSNNKFKYAKAYKIIPRYSSEGTLFLSIGYNGGLSSNYNKYKGIIEFNPSKCGLAFFVSLHKYFDFTVSGILSFDLAFDVPGVDINSCSFMVRNERIMSIGSMNNRSWYISPSVRDGRVKVYQKDVERKLHDVEIEKTLRIEISIDCPFVFFASFGQDELNKFQKYVDKLNAVYWISSEDSLLLLLSAVDEDLRARALALMDYRARKKYKDLLKTCSCNLNISVIEFSCLILDFLKDYCKGGKFVYDDCLFNM